MAGSQCPSLVPQVQFWALTFQNKTRPNKTKLKSKTKQTMKNSGISLSVALVWAILKTKELNRNLICITRQRVM